MKLQLITAGELDSPTSVDKANDGSNRLFICEQRGPIRVLQNGVMLPSPFLDISAKLVPERIGFDERGLLGLAFHPSYESSGAPGHGRFYVFYSTPSPNAPGTTENPVDCRTVIAEYRVSSNPNVADPATERVVLSFDKPQFNHNGGQLEFGPDGFLYASTGDGGSSNDNNAGHSGGSPARPPNALGNAQDKTNLLGKILRIDPLGTNGPGGQFGIPADNPFVGAGGGVREEIFCYGLRNPWRFSFDQRPGGSDRLFIADVGQGNFEEIDLGVSGGNYGWRNKEGSSVFAPEAPASGPFIDPISEYAHPTTPDTTLPKIGISVTGGYVYRGSGVPGLAGAYIFGDWSNDPIPNAPPAGTLLGLEETPPNVFRLSLLDILGGNPIATRILAFGEDEEGEIYVATKTTRGPTQPDPVTGTKAGALWKLVPASEQRTATFNPVADTSMYSEGPLSNAKGSFVFAGQNNRGNNRRALLKFDLSSLPPGTSIQSATLDLKLQNPITTLGTTVTIHRVGADWDEGTSTAVPPEGAGGPATIGDATWLRQIFDTISWTAPGGDFTASPSALQTVSTDALYSWTGDGMKTDVEAWVNNPETNFGWLVKGDETRAFTAKRFASRENGDEAVRPRLGAVYGSQSHYDVWLYAHFSAGEFAQDHLDFDGDGISNGLEYAWGFDPKSPNEMAAGFTFELLNMVGSDRLIIRFRRDPLATDLTYKVEMSSDLAQWNDIVSSQNGAAPAGMGFVSESEISGEAPMKMVTAQDPVSSPTASRFARLVVTRS
ncbi:MAG: PQQ-dependent sugar dehydrogenase [Verrucomicrobiales bacterium]